MNKFNVLSELCSSLWLAFWNWLLRVIYEHVITNLIHHREDDYQALVVEDLCVKSSLDMAQIVEGRKKSHIRNFLRPALRRDSLEYRTNSVLLDFQCFNGTLSVYWQIHCRTTNCWIFAVNQTIQYHKLPVQFFKKFAKFTSLLSYFVL